MHAVEHSPIWQRRRPITEGIGCCVPAGIDHDRGGRIHLTNCRDQLAIQGRQITRAALLTGVPLLHTLQLGMLGQAAMALWRRLVDQVVGRHGG